MVFMGFHTIVSDGQRWLVLAALVGALADLARLRRRVPRVRFDAYIAARLMDGLGVVAAVLLVFVGGFWWRVAFAITLVLAFLGRVGIELRNRRRSGSTRSDWMERQLSVGYKLGKRVRLAYPGQQLLDACTEFTEWGDEVNDWVVEHHPLLYPELTQIPPSALFGKGWSLAHIDDRLKSHAKLVQQLKDEGE